MPVSFRLFLFAPLIFLVPALFAQEPASPPGKLTAEQHRADMMEKLGIQGIRPGANASPDGPNAANYDEAKANPYSDLPDVLRLSNGKPVTTPEAWWTKRRPEIAAAFEREVYGRIPNDVPSVDWTVEIAEREYLGWTPVLARKIKGRVDNSQYPFVEVNISMTLVTPANATGPVPVLMMFSPATLPAPVQPDFQDFERLNAAMRTLLSKDSAIREILEKYPAYNPLVRPEGVNAWGWYVPQTNVESSPVSQLVAKGWGYALIDPASIQPDNAEGLTRGIIGLVNKGQTRAPDDWGALRAWSWGAARALDYLETDSTVDAKRVGIEGVSRYGKAALVTLAFEPRFFMGLIGSSGKGGATLHRRNFGEAVENLAGGGFHWMAGNYLKYASSKGKFANWNASNLPVDSHQLIALCAPRLTFISYGIPERGDAHWLDQQGSFMAAVAASPVFELLGAKGLGVRENFKEARMPPVNKGLLEGHLAWRQHDGGHTDTPNIPFFIEWVEKFFKTK